MNTPQTQAYKVGSLYTWENGRNFRVSDVEDGVPTFEEIYPVEQANPVNVTPLVPEIDALLIMEHPLEDAEIRDLVADCISDQQCPAQVTVEEVLAEEFGVTELAS